MSVGIREGGRSITEVKRDFWGRLVVSELIAQVEAREFECRRLANREP